MLRLVAMEPVGGPNLLLHGLALLSMILRMLLRNQT